MCEGDRLDLIYMSHNRLTGVLILRRQCDVPKCALVDLYSICRHSAYRVNS